MDVLSVLFEAFFWILVILAIWFLFVETVVRAVRHFAHFPIPAFITRFIDNPLRRAIQPPGRVVDWIGISGGMEVLEIGPGPGTFTTEAARRAGEAGHLAAVDIQPSVITKLETRLRKEGIRNATTKVASAYELPFPDRTFDRAFMITVLAEVPDKRRALLEIGRVLKDDGLLAIGELLIDPDYPRRKTVTRWCKDSSLRLVEEHGGVMHYLLAFRKADG